MSFNNRPNGFALMGRHQSLDTINTETSPTQSGGVANLPGGVAPQKRANSMGGVAGRNSNTGEEEFTAGIERRLFDLSLHHPPSPLATQNTCSSSSSQESLPVTMTTASHGLADVSKAELIATLAADPEAVSLMREAVSASIKQDTTNRELPPLYLRGAPVINGDEAQDQSEATLVPPALSGQSDSLLSPPAEFNPSLTLLERQTSTTYTQTDEGGATVSLTSSRATDCTSGYDSMKTASPTQGTCKCEVLLFNFGLFFLFCFICPLYKQSAVSNPFFFSIHFTIRYVSPHIYRTPPHWSRHRQCYQSHSGI